MCTDFDTKVAKLSADLAKTFHAALTAVYEKGVAVGMQKAQIDKILTLAARKQAKKTQRARQ